ncbi:MAG: RDD family protein [Chloroflexota bacterium]|nr:RDD family protein [Chloroflexota bacterium]
MDGDGTIVRASRPSRLLALLADLVLIVATLGIGWLAWCIALAPKGQSPGDALAKVRIIRRDGTAASMSRLGVRLGVRILLFGLIDYLCMFVNRDARTLHDLATRTIAVKAQGSEKVYERRAVRRMPAQAAPVTAAPAQFAAELLPTPAPVPEVSTVRPERPIAPGSDPTEMTLRRLEFLRSQKLITEQEYQDRRQTALRPI